MSENTTPEGTETATEDQHTTDPTQLPADHPLVKTLAAQKAEIKELKAKASRLDEYEEAQKSESEKVADRLAKADAAVAGIPAKVCEALRPYLIEMNGFDQEAADLLTATDPEALIKQAAVVAGLKGKRNNQVPREGRNPSAEPASDMRDFARNLFGNQ